MPLHSFKRSVKDSREPLQPRRVTRSRPYRVRRPCATTGSRVAERSGRVARDPSALQPRSRARVPKPGERQGWAPGRTQGASGSASRRAPPGPGLPARPRLPAPPSRQMPRTSPHRPTARRPAHPGSDCRSARGTPGRGGRPVIGPPQRPMRWQIGGAAPEARRWAEPSEEEARLALPGPGPRSVALVSPETGQADKRSGPKRVGDRENPRGAGLIPLRVAGSAVLLLFQRQQVCPASFQSP